MKAICPFCGETAIAYVRPEHDTKEGSLSYEQTKFLWRLADHEDPRGRKGVLSGKKPECHGSGFPIAQSELKPDAES